jgi:hypothetical protein
MSTDALTHPLAFLSVTLQAIAVGLLWPASPVRLAAPLQTAEVVSSVVDTPAVPCPPCGQCVEELKKIIELQGSLAFWWALALGLIAVLVVAVLALCCSVVASVLRRRLLPRPETSDLSSAAATSFTPSTRRALAQR